MQPNLWAIQLPFASPQYDYYPRWANYAYNYTNILLKDALTSPCSIADDCTRYVRLGCDGILRLWTPANGTTTTGSPHPRSELEQMTLSNGTLKKAKFSGMDTNVMLTTVSVDVPVAVSVAQVFFIGNSTNAGGPWGIVNTSPNADGTGLVYFHVHIYYRVNIDTRYHYGHRFQLNVTVTKNVIYVGYTNYDSGFVNNVKYDNGIGDYYFGFKSGSYCQVIANATNNIDACHVSIHDLQVTGPSTTFAYP